MQTWKVTFPLGENSCQFFLVVTLYEIQPLISCIHDYNSEVLMFILHPMQLFELVFDSRKPPYVNITKEKKKTVVYCNKDHSNPFDYLTLHSINLIGFCIHANVKLTQNWFVLYQCLPSSRQVPYSLFRPNRIRASKSILLHCLTKFNAPKYRYDTARLCKSLRQPFLKCERR